MFIANISLSFLFSIWYKRLWTKMIYICMVMFYFSLWFIAVTFYSKKSIPILKSFKCLHRPWTNPLVYVISISKFSLLINLELNFNYGWTHLWVYLECSPQGSSHGWSFYIFQVSAQVTSLPHQSLCVFLLHLLISEIDFSSHGGHITWSLLCPQHLEWWMHTADSHE